MIEKPYKYNFNTFNKAVFERDLLILIWMES